MLACLVDQFFFLLSRQDHGPLDEVKPFDWTFSTDYTGTLLGDFKVVSTEERIDMEKLRQKERILFYEDITLFEDELHDNGIAVLSVKVVSFVGLFFIQLNFTTDFSYCAALYF